MLVHTYAMLHRSTTSSSIRIGALSTLNPKPGRLDFQIWLWNLEALRTGLEKDLTRFACPSGSFRLPVPGSCCCTYLCLAGHEGIEKKTEAGTTYKVLENILENNF